MKGKFVEGIDASFWLGAEFSGGILGKYKKHVDKAFCIADCCIVLDINKVPQGNLNSTQKLWHRLNINSQLKKH